MEGLKIIVEKISQYNFLTNILPGTLLCVLLKYIVEIDIIPENKFHASIFFYFVGLVNGRFGALVVEPFLKKVKWINFVSYRKFVFAESKDSKISILSQENNVYRSYLSVICLVAITFVFQRYIVTSSLSVGKYTIEVLLISFLLLFSLAYRRQTSYVRKRVESVCEREGFLES